MWGLNEMWPRKRKAQHVAHGKHLISSVGSLPKYNLRSIPLCRGVACLGLTLRMQFGLHATNRQLTWRAVRTTFTWGTFVNRHPVHHVLPVVSENMQRLCQNLMLDCSLRPPLVSVWGVSLPHWKQEWHRNIWPLRGVLGSGHLSWGLIRIQVVSLSLLLEGIARTSPGLLKQLDLHQDKLLLMELHTVYIFFFAQPRTKISRGFRTPQLSVLWNRSHFNSPWECLWPTLKANHKNSHYII